MRVRKHVKKITMLEEKILDEGEMNTREIHDWLNARIRMGVTMNWVGNVLAKCGLFDKIGEERVPGLSTNYVLAVWDSRRRGESE
tara:strand:+ start:323 stop:577 length:255 start_codon:yes stop_codon:yes gene_type:complete